MEAASLRPYILFESLDSSDYFRRLWVDQNSTKLSYLIVVANFPSLPFCSHGSIRHVFAVFCAAICYDKQTSTIQHGASCFPLQLRNKNTYRNTMSGFNVRYCSVQWLPHISFHKSPPTIQLWNRLHWNCQFFLNFIPLQIALIVFFFFKQIALNSENEHPKWSERPYLPGPKKVSNGCELVVLMRLYCR